MPGTPGTSTGAQIRRQHERRDPVRRPGEHQEGDRRRQYQARATGPGRGGRAGQQCRDRDGERLLVELVGAREQIRQAAEREHGETGGHAIQAAVAKRPHGDGRDPRREAEHRHQRHLVADQVLGVPQHVARRPCPQRSVVDQRERQPPGPRVVERSAGRAPATARPARRRSRTARTRAPCRMRPPPRGARAARAGDGPGSALAPAPPGRPPPPTPRARRPRRSRAATPPSRLRACRRGPGGRSPPPAGPRARAPARPETGWRATAAPSSPRTRATPPRPSARPRCGARARTRARQPWRPPPRAPAATTAPTVRTPSPPAPAAADGPGRRPTRSRAYSH